MFIKGARVVRSEMGLKPKDLSSILGDVTYLRISNIGKKKWVTANNVSYYEYNFNHLNKNRQLILVPSILRNSLIR